MGAVVASCALQAVGVLCALQVMHALRCDVQSEWVFMVFVGFAGWVAWWQFQANCCASKRQTLPKYAARVGFGTSLPCSVKTSSVLEVVWLP